ncbi:HSP20-like chaperone [Cucurbitaria berberidis CBS 394.84]|uniref:HSP20-like chaperone n=1 Tax=Cucurbitaria berberidis CBS 394.84 TaxID=1168544 RepID=A0A9P4GQZ5_9PLEO|nr:HSP20-like chaperone [Cucurbitaria berberidis CBS 394.84]KAF1849732.1 HSP20-like chaperone [Cucurbitaria berberidis CBS 394.84]
MAFVLTPHFAPTSQAPQCSPFGFCTPHSRPTYPYHVSRPQPRRPAYSSFNHFFNQVDELLSEIDREARREAQRQAQFAAHVEAQREAHRQRQQRKRALRAEFAVGQHEQGWQIVGEIQGFDQENISIEVTDEHTLKVAGNTKWQSEKSLPKTQQSENEGTSIAGPVALTESEEEATTTPEATTIGPDSDTESHKSYQATVEDDFEDLGAEYSSLTSTSSTVSEPTEPTEPTEPSETTRPKGKDKVVKEPAATHTAVAQQPQPEVPAQQQQERLHGSFERTFRFPQRIDAANVTASFKDGGLKITVPRAQALQTRRIAII